MHRVSWENGFNVGRLLLILIAVLPGCAEQTCPAIDTKDMAQYENADPDVFEDCNGEQAAMDAEGAWFGKDVALVYGNQVPNVTTDSGLSVHKIRKRAAGEDAGGSIGGGGTKTGRYTP